LAEIRETAGDPFRYDSSRTRRIIEWRDHGDDVPADVDGLGRFKISRLFQAPCPVRTRTGCTP